MSSQADREDLQTKVTAAAENLIEYCDAVVILASTTNGESDFIEYSYRGSFHTVLGLMEDFKIKKSTQHLEHES